MTTPTPEIHIHNSTLDAGAHVWRVVATFLAIGAFVSLAWGLAQWGWLDVAATGLTATMAMLVQLLARNGMIALPERAEVEDERIEAGRSAIRDIVGMVQAFIDRSSLARLTLIAVAYGVGFMVVRLIVAWGLGILGNVWVAIAVGLIVASLICFPTLFAGLMKAVKTPVKKEVA